MKALEAYVLANKKSNVYTDESILGVDGVLKGAPCEIDDITTNDAKTKSTITFKWETTVDDETTTKTDTLDIPLPVISENDDNDDDNGIYKLDVKVGSTTLTTSNLIGKADYWVFGTKIKATALEEDEDTITYTASSDVISDVKVGDCYYNTNTADIFKCIKNTSTTETVDDVEVTTYEQQWQYRGNVQGASAYDVWTSIDGNANKTKAQFIEAITGDGLVQKVVESKPNIKLDSTDMNTWYYYQVTDTSYDTSNFKDMGAFYSALQFEKDTTRSIAIGKYYQKIPEGRYITLNDGTYKKACWDEDSEDYYPIYRIFDIKKALNLGSTERACVYQTLYNCKVALLGRTDSECRVYEINTSDSSQTLIAELKGEYDSETDTEDTDYGYFAYVGGSTSVVDDYTEITEDSLFGTVYTFASALINTTAWKYQTSIITEVFEAGDYALWDGTRYMCATLRTGITSALLETYNGGFFSIFDSTKNRAWLFGIINTTTTDETTGASSTSTAYYMVGDLLGSYVTYASSVPTGYTEVSWELTQLGKWAQTIYVGNSKAEAGEVTLSTGTTATSDQAVLFVGEASETPNTLKGYNGQRLFTVKKGILTNPPDSYTSDDRTHNFIYQVTYNHQMAIDQVTDVKWYRDYSEDDAEWSEWQPLENSITCGANAYSSGVLTTNLTFIPRQGMKIAVRNVPSGAVGDNTISQFRISCNGRQFKIYQQNGELALGHIGISQGTNVYVITVESTSTSMGQCVVTQNKCIEVEEITTIANLRDDISSIVNYDVTADSYNPPDTLTSDTHTHEFIIQSYLNRREAIDKTNGNKWIWNSSTGKWIADISAITLTGTLSGATLTTNLASGIELRSGVMLNINCSSDLSNAYTQATCVLGDSTATINPMYASMYGSAVVHSGYNAYVYNGENYAMTSLTNAWID